MCIRSQVEEIERSYMSEFATLSSESIGRQRKEEPDPIRTCFAVDRDRIIHSKAFKRLKGKTQVFIMPSNDHFMNRLTHTLEAAQIARTIAVALNLNETLVEAIMLGHDLAHSCFGHAGEEALNGMTLYGYEHSTEALRRIEVLEKHNGQKGLNLTKEVLNGIINHSSLNNNPKAFTKEGMIAPFADKIAFLTSDMENAISAGIISDIPSSIKAMLGETKSQMITTMVKDIISTSKDKPWIKMSPHVFESTMELKNFMYEKVYYSQALRQQAEKAHKIIYDMYDYLMKHPDQIPEDYDDPDVERNIIDYISSMTDSYCLELYKKYFFI